MPRRCTLHAPFARQTGGGGVMPRDACGGAKAHTYLGCSRDELQEQGDIFPAERSENVPEPLHFLVRSLEVGVLRVVLPGRGG